jgi:putative inorganic carbon (HCO3(-)) transporter
MKRTILDWGIFLLLFQVLVSSVIITEIDLSLTKITNLLFGILLFYSLLGVLNSEKIMKWSIIGFLSLGSLFTIFCLLGVNLLKDRLTTPFPIITKISIFLQQNTPIINWNLKGAEIGFNANAVGGVMTLFIPLFLVFLIWLSREKRKENAISILKSLYPAGVILFGVMIALIILTLSFGSWLGCIFGILVLLFFLQNNKAKKRILVLLLIVIVFVTAFLLETSLVKGKIELRSVRWMVGFQVVKENPFTGIGMNQFRQIPSIGYERSHAFNHLLHTAAELGIPGLIAYLVILIASGFMCIKVWQKSGADWMRLAAAGLGCGQLAHLIFGMTDSIPLGAKPGFIFWVSLALIAALYSHTKEKS